MWHLRLCPTSVICCQGWGCCDRASQQSSRRPGRLLLLPPHGCLPPVGSFTGVLLGVSPPQQRACMLHCLLLPGKSKSVRAHCSTAMRLAAFFCIWV